MSWTGTGRCAVAALALAGALGAAAGSAQATTAGSNGKIAFASNRDGNVEIYSMNADGSDQTRLTDDAARDTEPAWSPDGRKIAFMSNRDNPSAPEIYVMNADGTGQTNVTNSAASDLDPEWSPDGSKIVFTSTRTGGPGDIFVMNPDGTGVTRLTTDSGSDYFPSWSPDGAKIAWTAQRGSGNEDIFVMNADGTNQSAVTSGPAFDVEPSWSPDGSKIAFRRGSDVWSMNGDGSDATDLTSGSAPEWAPDGSKIVFSTTRDGNAEVYSMNPDGSSPANVSANASSDVYPAWGVAPALVYSFSGFFRPVDNPPTLNVVKAGSAVPVKFSLGGFQGLQVLAAESPSSSRVSCDGSQPTDAVETETAGGSGLTYDPLTDTYAYVWKTSKSWAGTCRQLMVTTDDGGSHPALFRLR